MHLSALCRKLVGLSLCIKWLFFSTRGKANTRIFSEETQQQSTVDRKVENTKEIFQKCLQAKSIVMATQGDPPVQFL